MKKTLFLLLIILLSLVSFGQSKKNQNEQLAIQYYQSGEYEKAAELFEDIFDKKQDTYIYYYYYQTLLNLNEYKKLEKIVKKLQRSNPNIMRYKVDLGNLYERSGEREKAEKVYDEAIKTLPAQNSKINELYHAFLSRALRDKAITTLLHGRKLLNDEKVFSKELTSLYMQLGWTDKIIAEALALLKDNDPTYLRDAETIIQNLLVDDIDQTKYLNVKLQLQKLTQKDPDNSSYISLLYWIYQLHKDFQDAFILAKSLDKRYKEDGERVFALAMLAEKNRDFDVAIQAYQYVLDKGEKSSYYTKAKFNLLETKYKKITSQYPIKREDVLVLEKEFAKLIEENGMHSGTADWIRKYAYLLAFYVNKPAEAINLLNAAIHNAQREPLERALYKVDLADIELFTNNVWDATLLYSQVEKDFPNDTIGHLAKFKNAKLSFYIGEFGWAKSQLDVLRAATSKLIANDAMYLYLLIADNEEDIDDEDEDDEMDAEDTTYNFLFQDENRNIPLKLFAKADFLIFKNQNDQAVAVLDSILMIDPYGKLADDVYFQKAKLQIKKGDYLGAEKKLKVITEKYAYDLLADDAFFYLGELYQYHFKDIQSAMKYYQTLMRDYPGSIYVVEARKRYRELRGDDVYVE